MGRNVKKITSSLVAFLFTMSLLLTGGTKKVNAETTTLTKDKIKQTSLKEKTQEIKPSDKFSGVEYPEVDTENISLKTEGSEEETIRVIVEVSGEPASEKLDVVKEEDVKEVIEEQQEVKEQVEEVTDNKVENSYGNLINGFSIDVKRKDLDEVAEIPGVTKITEANVYYPTMATAVDLTQASEIWKSYGYEGEGLVVSIIDTGIDYTHKDMRDPSDKDAMKIKTKTPEGPGKYYTDKVPYGYNFADDNNQVIDTTSSMHGMHVAGIVAANGSDEDVANGKGVRGVAPEAQLLAMKVFTNNPEISGAYSDDIIAAIEDSVLHGADIINMSLGSSAGYRDAEDPEQIAIKKATDAGVICVVSAGNSSYSTDPYWHASIKDTATIGAPGLAEDALQVASFENTIVKLPALNLEVNGTSKLLGQTIATINPADVFKSGEKLQLVDCNLGQTSDFNGKDLSGKIALIKRGAITFIEKAQNAQKAGAAAVIIYNHESGGDSYINMAEDESITIPYVFVTNTSGNELKNSIANGGTVSFGEYTVSVPNVSSGQMSDFTSWGPAPNLEFAPQITGPGGNIYSTVNSDRYTSMSGTSMSSPHVAGSTALIIEGLKKEGINLSGRELVNFVKNTAINTADIIIDKEGLADAGTPYSPRRQGSGMIKTKDAIENRVLALGNEGKATISLKEIGNATSFDITLKNYGSSDETYTLETPGGVLTAYSEKDMIVNGYMPFDVALEGAKVTFDKNEVTVPANGEIKVTATLAIPETAEKDIFAEGYIKFVNKDVETSSLVVPYMGFYGSWSNELIMNYPAWEANETNIFPPSFAAVDVLGEYAYAGGAGEDSNGNVIINKDSIAISPNEDLYGDSLLPALYPLRNAKEVTVDVLNASGEVVASNVKTATNLRKKIYNTSDGSGQNASVYSDLLWDGKIFNKSTGKYEVVPGQYSVRLNSKVDLETAVPQSLIIPVKVDITEPQIDILSSDKSDSTSYELKLKASDDLSGVDLSSLVVYVNGQKVKAEATVVNDVISVNVALKDDSLNTIVAAIADNAYNATVASIDVVAGEIPYVKPALTLNVEEGKQFTTNAITVEGKVTGSYGKVIIAGKEVDFSAGNTFAVDVTLAEGRNYIPLYVEDVNGKVIVNYSLRVYCDTEAPVITLTNPTLKENNVIVTPVEEIVLKGTVSDNTMGYKFYINGENLFNTEVDGMYGHDVTRKEFYKDLKVANGDSIEIKAVDLFGHETVQTYTVEVNSEAPIASFEGVSNNGLFNKDVTPVINVLPEFKVVSATLNGNAYNFETITEEGQYTLEVVLGLNKDRENNAVNGLTVVEDNSVKYVVSFAIDKTAPVITVSGVDDGAVYNNTVTPVVTSEEGTVLEYKLNGQAYEGTAITEAGEYTLEVTATDKAGNVSTKVIKFSIDKTAPVIKVEGVVDGMKYNKAVEPKISVDDESAEVIATLNGNSYDGAKISENGKYSLKVTATDKAGNKSEVSYDFEIALPVVGPGENPTPNPTPGDNGTIGGEPTNDTPSTEVKPSNPTNNTKVDNSKVTNSNSTTIVGKGSNLPKTGQDAVVYVIILAVALVVIGGSLVIKKRKKSN